MSSDIVGLGCLVHVGLSWNMKVVGGGSEVVEELARGDICVFSGIVMRTVVI